MPAAQARDVGTGLLNRPMADNPFSESGEPGSLAGGVGGLLGGSGLSAQAGRVGGLLSNGLQNRAKMMTASGRGLLG
ncbi:hypothetical protein [Roseateles sp. P5_E8]